MTGPTTWERWRAGLPARDRDERARFRELDASAGDAPARSRSAIGTVHRALPRPLFIALYVPLFAAMSAISAFRWWHGEPLLLRVALCACYGGAAVVSLAVAAWLRVSAPGAEVPS